MFDPCTILPTAARELEVIRHLTGHTGGASHFPTSCHRLVKNLPGNQRCCDCGAANPDWACVSYGTLVCMTCSGRHRSYGVSTSVVRSMTMDAWSHQHVLAMLEGGNSQMKGFFERHDLGNASPLLSKRYHTKAAQFYKINLQKHVRRVTEHGEYQGREFNRTKQVRSTSYRRQQQQQQPPPQHQQQATPGGTAPATTRQNSCKESSSTGPRRTNSQRQQALTPVQAQ
jgi:Putative GTPase activating protein for Arf